MFIRAFHLELYITINQHVNISQKLESFDYGSNCGFTGESPFLLNPTLNTTVYSFVFFTGRHQELAGVILFVQSFSY